MSATLNDRVLTFLNRAAKLSLGPLAPAEIDAFFAKAFKKLGLHVSPDHRRSAVAATCGSPYLLQLVGHNLVLYAADNGTVDGDSLENALASARASFENDVCGTTLSALSDKDACFLVAMSEDERESRLADVAERMGVTQDYAQKYRKRLISAGIIVASRRGYVRFAVPYLADHLRRTCEIATDF